MIAKNSPSHTVFNSCRMGALSFLICLTLCTSAKAQNTPPILKEKESSAFNPDQIKALRDRANAGNTEDAKWARNRLIAITVEQIDTAFKDYRKKDRKNSDRLQFLFDFLEIGASSAISIVGGARPKALIGEALSLFQGSRSAFNKDFRFLERKILFDKMVASRAEKLTAIYEKFDKSVMEYPWEQARSELNGYFYAGTIDEALNTLSHETGKQATDAEEQLARAKREAGIRGPVSPAVLIADQAFDAVIKPILAANEAAKKKIEDENAKPAGQPNQATIDSAKADQQKLLDKMKAIFKDVNDSSILEPLLPEISKSSPGRTLSEALTQKIERSLSNAKANNATFEDYQLVLGNLRRVVVEMVDNDTRPNNELHRILE